MFHKVFHVKHTKTLFHVKQLQEPFLGVVSIVDCNDILRSDITPIQTVDMFTVYILFHVKQS